MQHGLDYGKKQEAVMSMGWKDENRSLPRSISLYEWNEFLMWMLLNEFVSEQIVPNPFISLQNFVFVMFVMRFAAGCKCMKSFTPHLT